MFNLTDAYEIQKNYNMKVNVKKEVATEMGADIVIVDPSDIKPNKIYKFMTGYLP